MLVGMRIFISFEYERDLPNARNFVTQAKGRGYARPILDNSLNEQRRSHDTAWKAKAGQLIHESDVVVVLLGPDTHNALGVSWEIRTAIRHNVQIVQVRPQGSRYTTHPLLPDHPVVVWKWKNLDKHLRR